jgi:hypothetical protein
VNPLAAIGLLGLIRWVARQEDPDRPTIIFTNEKSTAVLKRAEELALAGREDPHAVAELRALSRRRPRALRQALRASRSHGFHHERRDANRAYRLLDAAQRRAPVAAATAEDQERIEAIETLMALDPVARWARFVALEPRLDEFAAGVGASDRVGPARFALATQLDAIVGPQSGQHDLLLRSESALRAAATHLLHPPAPTA